MLIAIIVELGLSQPSLEWVGVKPSANRVFEERRAFHTTFDQPFLLIDPRNASDRLRFHLGQLQSELQNPSRIQSQFLDRFRTQMFATAINVLPTVEVFSLRGLSLIASLPLIAMGCMVVGLDGWVRREVRKAGAGIESARIYHVAKRSIKPLCLWLSLIYLTAPVTLDVRWVYGTLAVGIPILLGITISRFKKYV